MSLCACVHLCKHHILVCMHRCRHATLLASMWTCGHAYNWPFKHVYIDTTLHAACDHAFVHICSIKLDMNTSTSLYMHASICAFIHVCICMLMLEGAYMCEQVCIHELFLTCIYAFMHVSYIHIWKQKCMSKCKLKYMFTYAHVRLYARIRVVPSPKAMQSDLGRETQSINNTN